MNEGVTFSQVACFLGDCLRFPADLKNGDDHERRLEYASCFLCRELLFFTAPDD